MCSIRQQLLKTSPLLGQRPIFRSSLYSFPTLTTKMTEDPAPKRIRTELAGPKVIGTHNGTFHADEALAVHLVRQLPDFRNSRLVRTRDPKLLETCDIVVDVGGVYDPSTHRYDHHQRGFEETYSPEFRTKLSSAGLIYKHFATQIISNQLALAPSHPSISTLTKKLYTDFVEALDAIDNGVNEFELVSKDGQSVDPAQMGVEIKSRYRNRTGLSARVGQLNPRWNQPTSSEILDAQFEAASTLAGQEFFSALSYLAEAWLPARDIVQRAVEERFQKGGDPQGRIMVMDEFGPWKEHLHLLESSLNIPPENQPLYILYPDESQKWRIQAVPITPESFESRKPLPEAWRGVRDEQLSELTGIPGCIFVHASGFIGGNATREGAMAMATKALQL